MTHHTECWAVHLDCARAEILRLRRSITALESEKAAVSDALAKATQHRTILADQLEELQRIAEDHDRPHHSAYSNGA